MKRPFHPYKSLFELLCDGLKEEGNPQNEYINAEIIDSNNFSYFLQQNNVITNSNIPSHILSSNSFKFFQATNMSPKNFLVPSTVPQPFGASYCLYFSG